MVFLAEVGRHKASVSSVSQSTCSLTEVDQRSQASEVPCSGQARRAVEAMGHLLAHRRFSWSAFWVLAIVITCHRCQVHQVCADYKVLHLSSPLSVCLFVCCLSVSVSPSLFPLLPLFLLFSPSLPSLPLSLPSWLTYCPYPFPRPSLLPSHKICCCFVAHNSSGPLALATMVFLLSAASS